MFKVLPTPSLHVSISSKRMEQSTFGEDEDTREKAFNEFRQEAWIMSGLRHPNIVMMKGYSITPLCLILEFVPFGELYNFINNSGEEISPVLRLRIASDIANGMAFLHGINPPLLHRDLKSPNVLLCAKTDNTAGDGPVAKVADFGTSMRVFSARKEKDFSVANPLWLAPEMLVGGIFTPAADVYSFAIILWEVAARTPPYKHIQFLHKIEEMVTKYVPSPSPSPLPCSPGLSSFV
jgi:serine/threonine protein kinase